MIRSMRFAASFLPCLLLLGCQANLPVGAVLDYQVDRAALDPGKQVDYPMVVQAVERRVNAGKRRGTVELVDSHLIRVNVFGSDAKVIAQVKRMLQSLGTLEFRIVANQTDHADLITRAQELPIDLKQVKEADGQVMARWIRADAKSIQDFRSRTDLGQRELEGGQLEVLVKIDSFNVTGDYLIGAKPSESNGQPIVEFEFDSKGAALFGGLTGANLPTAGGHSRALGIILDGQLMSAPSIRSIITNRGIITGNFTVEEVQDMTAILRAGVLPAPLELVGERTVEPR